MVRKRSQVRQRPATQCSAASPLRIAARLVTVALVTLLAGCAPSDVADAEVRLYLTVSPQGAGTVVITSEFGTTDCSESCIVTFPKGTTVSLEPSPADVGPFVGWTGECDGVAPCELRLDADRAVTATFAEHVLVVRMEGDTDVRADVTPGPGGAGTWTCTSDCIVPYDGPLTVSIAVTPTEPDTILGPWTGCATVSGDAYCLIGVTGRTEVSFVAVRPPVAVDDAYTVVEDQPVPIPSANGVLANDRDSPTDTLRVAAIADEPRFGTITMEPDGGFTYVPDLDANVDVEGIDHFVYVAADAYGNAAEPATVEITVLPVNDAPTFEIPDDPSPVKDGSGAQVVPSFAEGIGPGGGEDEADQALTLSIEPVSTTGSLVFREPPELALDGTLRYTASTGTFGSATFSAVLVDDGGSERGGTDRSTRDFTITVEPLVVTLIVEGPGTATLTPEGGSYAYGTWVMVRATPDEDAEIDDWGGACGYVKTKNDTCLLLLTSDVDVILRFDED